MEFSILVDTLLADFLETLGKVLARKSLATIGTETMDTMKDRGCGVKTCQTKQFSEWGLPGVGKLRVTCDSILHLLVVRGSHTQKTCLQQIVVNIGVFPITPIS